MKRWLPFIKSPPRVAVIRLQGVISSGNRGGISDLGTAPLLERAFKRGKPDAVALVINSPGGSPVQSSLIGARIRRLAEENEIPVYAFVEDVAASGGYWIAASADEIWVDQSSLVGSIGAISSGFGFQGFLEEHKIERRVYAAGTSKSFLDPFQAPKDGDVARMKDMLAQIHGVFIDHIKVRRGEKLDTETDLFDGAVWIGTQAVERGLADGIGHLVPKMKELYGDNVTFARYGQRRSMVQRLGMALSHSVLDTVEERAAFAAHGL